MLQASKYTGPMLLTRPEAAMIQKQHSGIQPVLSRSIIGRHYESPMAMAKQNHIDQSRKFRDRASPIKGILQDLPMNQYDSVMASSRLEEIRRKYDGNLKKFQEPHTPLRDLSDSKSHSMSRAKWQSKQIIRANDSVMGSATKQRESDFLADQVKQIRTSFKMQESKISRQSSRNSSMFSSEIPSFGRPHQRTTEDPRVESIDKINLKIKQILNCLNENERHIGQGGPPATSRYNRPAQQMTRDRDMKELPPRDNRSINTIASAKPQLKISQSFISNGENSRQSLIAKSFEQIESKQESRRHSMYIHKPTNNKFERAQSIIPMKNSVLMNKRQTSSSMIKSTNGDYILSSGKDLDEEIRKIQQKIRHSQEEKRRLDIKFQSRHQHLGIDDRNNTPVTVMHPSSLQTKDQRNQKSIESIYIPKLYYQKLSTCKDLINTEESPSFKQLPVFREDTKSKETLRSMISRDNTSTSIHNISIAGNQNTTSIASATKFNLGGKETQKEDLNSRYYGHRRPTPQILKIINIDVKPEPQSPKGIQTKRLVDHLKQQVVYDEELRNSKLNFAALQDPTKWIKLSDELKKHGIGYSQEQLKVQFELSLQEHNPFYSVRETQQPIDSVAKKYVVSHDYWNKQICHLFNQNDFERESFRQDRVDLERKGYLTVQDFVRFLNIETGTFYRNRDLILIFRRMSTEPHLTFNTFMKVVCR